MTKVIVIGIYILMKVFEAVMDHLDRANLGKELPDNVKDVYNQKEYEKFVQYEKAKGNLNNIESVIGILIDLGLLMSNAYAWLFDRLASFNMYIQYLLFIIGFTFIEVLISIPFSYYRTFVIEEKFGMNETTKKVFVTDRIKNLIESCILSYLLMALIMVCFETFGLTGVIYITIALIAFVLVLNALIVPYMRIYNKFDPIEDGELKDRLLELCDKYGVKVKKIVIKDASRRTTKANAFCTGLKEKTISLDDNLVNNYSVDEIVAVFAHEFAHAKYKHVLKTFPLSMLNIVIIASAIGIVLEVPALFEAFGFDGANYYFAEILITILSWPLMLVLEIVANYFSRKHEYEADSFAAKEGYGESLISSLKRLSKGALSDVNPHPLRVVLDYSHPTLSQRIKNIRDVSADAGEGK